MSGWTWTYYGRCAAEIHAPDGTPVAIVGYPTELKARAMDTDWYRSVTPTWVAELDEASIPQRQKLAAQHAATIVEALNATPTNAAVQPDLFAGGAP